MNDPIKDEGTMLVTALQRRHRVSVKYPNGAEMVEEYDAESGKLELRRWQSKNALGRSSGWVFEVGSDESAGGGGGGGAAPASFGAADLAPARNKNPVFVPQDHPAAFMWRIRNIPYPIATYQLAVDDEKQQLVLRTTNKKYFKRFSIPALRRHGLPLDRINIAMKHAHNCLVIRHKKPLKILDYERAHRLKIQKSLQAQGGEGGDADCKTQ